MIPARKLVGLAALALALALALAACARQPESPGAAEGETAPPAASADDAGAPAIPVELRPFVENGGWAIADHQYAGLSFKADGSYEFGDGLGLGTVGSGSWRVEDGKALLDYPAELSSDVVDNEHAKGYLESLFPEPGRGLVLAYDGAWADFFSQGRLVGEGISLPSLLRDSPEGRVYELSGREVLKRRGSVLVTERTAFRRQPDAAASKQEFQALDVYAPLVGAHGFLGSRVDSVEPGAWLDFEGVVSAEAGGEGESTWYRVGVASWDWWGVEYAWIEATACVEGEKPELNESGEPLWDLIYRLVDAGILDESQAMEK
ncbi:MAG: hypothetical protein JXA15_01570 [Spirochaetales bacterium]|nr:hypothetical protein [Spirochaetales bacterium]